MKDLEADSEEFLDEEKKLPEDHKVAIFVAFFLAVCHQLTGVSLVISYSGQLAEAFLPSLKETLPLYANAEQIVASIIAAWLLGRLGRKALLMGGLIALFGTLVGISVGFGAGDVAWARALVLICILVFLFAFMLTYGAITWIYIPEIVQPTLVPYTFIVHWVFRGLVMTLFPIIREAYGARCPQIYIFFALCVFVAIATLSRLMVETKGKTEYEIRQ